MKSRVEPSASREATTATASTPTSELPSPHTAIAQRQRTIGNRALGRRLRSNFAAPGDPKPRSHGGSFERAGTVAAPGSERDAHAGPEREPAIGGATGEPHAVQRSAGNRAVVQRLASGRASEVASTRDGHGAPLPPALRERMQGSFAADFSAVRIHEGPRAAALGAVAFTQGESIHFQPGRYDPAGHRGLEVLGHELAHVIQQRSGRVALPTGAGPPINADPELEAQANAMGRRAARGESVGQTAPSTGRAPSQAPVQCYTDHTLDNRHWRLSGGKEILVPKNPSHELYATKALIDRSEKQLSDVKSFIQLAAEGGAPAGAEVTDLIRLKPLLKVRASYRDQSKVSLHDKEIRYPVGHDEVARANAPEWEKKIAEERPNVVERERERRSNLSELERIELAGEDQRTRMPWGIDPGTRGGLRTFADCNKCAQMIMGEVGTERAVVTDDSGSQILETQDKSLFRPGGFDRELIQTELGGLTAMNYSLIAYRDSKRLGQLGEAKKELTPEIGVFLQLTKELRPEDPAKSWKTYHEIQKQTPAVFRDFSESASLDAAARPEVGEALVTYRVMSGDAKTLNKSPLIYKNAAASFGELYFSSGNVQEKKIADTPMYVALQRVFDEKALKDMKVGDLRLGTLPNNDVEALRRKLIEAAIHSYKATLGKDELADKYGITADSTYDEMTRKAEKSDDPRLKEGVAKDDLWNKHWGGVVMIDNLLGYDYVTLENDASTKETAKDMTQKMTGYINEGWRFQLYGAVTPGQSFHEQMLLGGEGDFGTLASTMRYRKGKATRRVTPSNEGLISHAVAIYREDLATKGPISQQKDLQAKLRGLFTAMKWGLMLNDQNRVIALIAPAIKALDGPTPATAASVSGSASSSSSASSSAPASATAAPVNPVASM